MHNPKRWIKFDLDEWASDPELQACGLAAQGLWVLLMRVAHRGEPYGYLRSQGRPIPESMICRLVSRSPEEVNPLLSELEKHHVFSRDEDGSIYCRRMVRDAQISEKGRADGKLGGNPLLKGLTPTANPYVANGVKEDKRREEKIREDKRRESDLRSEEYSDSENSPPVVQESLDCADALRSAVLAYKPDHRLSRDPAYLSLRDSWAVSIERLHRIDGRSWERIREVIGWLPSSNFWAPNIQSGEKLRKQFDRLEVEMAKTRGRSPPREQSSEDIAAEARAKGYEVFDGKST
jgi:hypothetical protein